MNKKNRTFMGLCVLCGLVTVFSVVYLFLQGRENLLAGGAKYLDVLPVTAESDGFELSALGVDGMWVVSNGQAMADGLWVPGLDEGQAGLWVTEQVQVGRNLAIINEHQSEFWLVRQHDPKTQAVVYLVQSTDRLLKPWSRQFMMALCIMFAGFLVGLVVFMQHEKVRRKTWHRKLRRINTDELTGIPNQQHLIQDLKQAEYTNLAFIKVQNFNSILNHYGPAVTDDVMKQVAKVISEFTDERLRKASYYRIQPAVFAVLEDQDLSFDVISDITRRLVKSVVNSRYQAGNGANLKLNVSIGAVSQNTDAFTLANMALQEAEDKQLPYYFISKGEDHLPKTYRADLLKTQRLLQALQQGRIKAYFQPIFGAKDLNIRKYECLARMVDESGSVLMMPDEFLPLAHRANVYYQITRAMVDHALEFAKKHDITVSLNISMSDVGNKSTRQVLEERVKNSGAGHLLQFELLENEAILDMKQVVGFIRAMQSLGCAVGLDDLGKGYSNFERLMRLTINFVKLDRAIMEHVEKNLAIQKVAKSIVKLAHKKHLEVTAEFCANRSIMDQARRLGVDFLQGNYLAPPGPKSYQAQAVSQVSF